ncbi:methionyl-tRNA formyltransferase [Variovorax sp. NFACC27]|uniref:methionyl-tRNA formyltransferase n=1 Tax=unclassified Variovorax TaxID=663243 RepID=UPI00089D91A2|nr:methionyl-tRNA formyltransferase [Variovorax sp. NFACC28]SEG05030.1 methionyl-tRNA formyltransferase [Variovorax sp. NFACC29]SFB99657.1 methionyl-tRNA formyltransferase [Variovorax sp. NFACC26]SFF79194.1 methionyl-tRNA formyltransferase [Variovorax sp. NFACC27]
MSRLRVVFAGTPEFARVALEAIAAAGHEVVLVMSQPDRPAGRGMKLQASPVKQCAVANDWPVAQPRSLRLDGKYPDEASAARDTLLAAKPDVMVVAAYGLILPQWVLDLPVRGCLNIHASLLPRWRGAAPIHRAIEAGDAQTGITIMQMDAGLDTGDMLLREAVDIGRDDNTARLHDRLAELGGKMIVEALARIGTLVRTPQPAEGVTYANKVEKHEALVDWTQPADAIVRRVLAFDPFPGANSPLDGETVKLWAGHAATSAEQAAPGTILAVSDTGVTVAAGAGSALTVTELQRPGGKRLAVADFLRGFDLKPGQAFG